MGRLCPGCFALSVLREVRRTDARGREVRSVLTRAAERGLSVVTGVAGRVHEAGPVFFDVRLCNAKYFAAHMQGALGTCVHDANANSEKELCDSSSAAFSLCVRIKRGSRPAGEAHD